MALSSWWLADCYWDGFIRSFHGLPDTKRRQNTSQGDSIPECDIPGKFVGLGSVQIF